MEIHVKDNALNSLEIGLNFYNKFLNRLNNIDISIKHFGDLKFTVIAIHNSIELFTKAILLDINEFLVFKADVEQDNILCSLLREQYDKKKKKAYIAYKTIDYKKSILILHKIFGDKINAKNYKTLIDLSEYRNTLTHLGYASTFEWYKILIVLNKALELMLEFYVKNLIKSEEYFTNKIIRDILNILDKSKEHIQGIWMASWEHIFETIDDKVELFFDNGLIRINDFKKDSEYGFYQEINFTFIDNGVERNMVWIFKYSYLNESIIIVDSKGLIVGSISIADENLVYSYDDNEIPENLEEVYIFIPKQKLKFEKNTVNDISNKAKSNRLKIKPEVLPSLINQYIKNQAIK